MTEEIRVILTFLLAFFSSLFVLPNLSHIANRIELVDVPNARKVHVTPRPLVGGIGVVVSATFSCLVFVSLEGMRGYFSGLSVLLLIGFFDDYQELGHRKKFLVQIVATALMIFLSHVHLSNFGDLLGLGDIRLPAISLLPWVVKVFCVVGVTNAVNMVDGIDGLAGGITLIAFLAFAALASLSGNTVLMLLNLAIGGAVLGFLRFNWSPSQLFMGDAGSLCLGFSLAFMAVALAQGESSLVKPIVALLVLAVPISDALVVMTKRVLRGKSPFKADRTHLHHILVAHGLDGQKPVKTIILLAAILCGIGIVGVYFQISEPVLFGIFVCYFVLNWQADPIVGGVVNVVKLFERNEKPRRCPAIVHSAYHKWKTSRFFRGATCYAVACDMQISCSNDPFEVKFPGTILNISRSGFLAQIDGLGFVCTECKTSITFPVDGGITVDDMRAEHLWSSKKDGAQFHGFMFTNLDDHQTDVLMRFINSQIL